MVAGSFQNKLLASVHRTTDRYNLLQSRSSRFRGAQGPRGTLLFLLARDDYRPHSSERSAKSILFSTLDNEPRVQNFHRDVAEVFRRNHKCFAKLRDFG